MGTENVALHVIAISIVSVYGIGFVLWVFYLLREEASRRTETRDVKRT